MRLQVTDVSALRRTRDATVPATLAGRPRAYQAQEDGRVLLTPTGGGQVLRLPLAAAPRPATTTTANGPALLDPATGLGGVVLAGSPVHNGTGTDAVEGLVGGFQLQAQSPLLPLCSTSAVPGCLTAASDAAADLRLVGALSTVPEDGAATGTVAVALTTAGAWTTPAYDPQTGAGPVRFDVFWDTDGDGTSDRWTAAVRGAPGTDVVEAATYRRPTSGNVWPWVDSLPLDGTGDAAVDSGVLSGDALVLPVRVSALGLPAGRTRVSYRVYTQGWSGDVDTVGPLVLDVAHPRLGVVPGLPGTLLSRDQPGRLAVRRDLTGVDSSAQQDLGLLLLHLHGLPGAKGEVVAVQDQAPVVVPPVVAPTGTPSPSASASPSSTPSHSASASPTASPSPTATLVTPPVLGPPSGVGVPPIAPPVVAPPAAAPPAVVVGGGGGSGGGGGGGGGGAAVAAPAVTPSSAPSASPSPSASASASTSASPTPSATTSPTPSAAATASPSADATPVPSAAAAPASAPTPTTAPSPSAAPSRPQVRVGSPALVAGQTSRVTVTGVPGSTVELLAYTRPATTYAVVRTLVVGPDGTATAVVRPLGNTRMYSRPAGSTAQGGDSVVLSVRASVSLRAARSGPRAYAFEGRVQPARAGQAVSVVRRDAAGREVLVARTTTRADGTWRLTRRFTASSTLMLLARSGATPDAGAGAAPAVRLAVR